MCSKRQIHKQQENAVCPKVRVLRGLVLVYWWKTKGLWHQATPPTVSHGGNLVTCKSDVKFPLFSGENRLPPFGSPLPNICHLVRTVCILIPRLVSLQVVNVKIPGTDIQLSALILV